MPGAEAGCSNLPWLPTLWPTTTSAKSGLLSLTRSMGVISLSLSAQESACCGEGRELFIILIFFPVVYLKALHLWSVNDKNVFKYQKVRRLRIFTYTVVKVSVFS